uniref:Retrotransposon protein-like n=1 Tax=Oryza nivara TaxID=4536 RepID=A0A679BDV5_ORYNI|nr:retrotransposon protein-like [Oryza sativa f. spontanea]
MSRLKSIRKCSPSPFHRKSHRHRCTSPGSRQPQQCIRPPVDKLSRSRPKCSLNHLARRNSKLSFGNSISPTTFRVQLPRLVQRGVQVKVHLVGCRRTSRIWGLRHGVRHLNTTSSMPPRRKLFGRKDRHQALEQAKHQPKSP